MQICVHGVFLIKLFSLRALGVGLSIEVGVPDGEQDMTTVTVLDRIAGRTIVDVIDRIEGKTTVDVLDGEASMMT
jgi:hypothetical protein